MRVWFDTEFMEDGKTIELISIGLVCEDGAHYYAESSECDLSRADPWVVKNVFPQLRGGLSVATRKEIAREIVSIVGTNPEFWAYYADYDWVALCQLYGRMVDLPNGWPMFCRDVVQLADGRILPEMVEGEHMALNDAFWTRRAWEYLRGRPV